MPGTDDDPRITVDTASGTPPYEQVRAQFAGWISDRTLSVGARLPTVRRLAADLGLAVNTVARAYRELEAAGLIETRGRAGSFVSAAGEQGRERARQAAQEYAHLTRSLGLDVEEAIAVVRAALLTGGPGGAGGPGGPGGPGGRSGQPSPDG